MNRFYFTLPDTDNQIVSSQTSPDWLQAKIDYYQAEIERLEKELKHVQILLQGHMTWKADVERKAKKASQQ